MKKVCLYVLLCGLFSGCTKPQPLVIKDFEIYLSRKNDIAEKLVKIILEARKEVLLTTYEANLPCVLSALAEAQRRGVKVALLLDDQTLPECPLPPTETYTDHNPNYLMHTKFGVVDGKISWLGSFNLTFSSAYQSDNDLIFFHSPEVSSYLRKAFYVLKSGREPSSLKKKNVPVKIYFTPKCQSALLEELESAQKKIFFSLYVLTDPKVINLLQRKARTGVKVSGVLERSWEGNKKAFDDLRLSGINVSWDQNYHLNHYKVFIIDEKEVITGSYNPSLAATRNQEILAIIDDPTVALFYRCHLSPLPDPLHFNLQGDPYSCMPAPVDSKQGF
ncbi:MAG: phospholipase D-like domain-containing protein [Candidatus Omnitrophota bacterium]